MRMPSSVHVFSQRVDVKRLPDVIQDKTLGACYGFYYPGRNLIEVGGEQSAERERETFLHENLHAIITVSKLDLLLPEMDEEKLVTSLAPFLLAWLRENRRAVQYLTERVA